VSDAPGGISVTGTGEATLVPDVMTVDVGVSVRAESVAAAAESSRAHAMALIDSLAASGVERVDIATTNYSVSPEYDYQDGVQRLLGFRVSNDLTVTLRDLERSGSVIDAAVAAAGDAVTVNRVVFSSSDEQPARHRAREAAWADAIARAEHLAELAGRGLGPAVSVVETPRNAPGPRPMARMAAVAEATPIEGGSVNVAVSLEVRFVLQD